MSRLLAPLFRVSLVGPLLICFCVSHLLHISMPLFLLIDPQLWVSVVSPVLLHKTKPTNTFLTSKALISHHLPCWKMYQAPWQHHHENIKHCTSAGSSNFLSVLSLTPYHFPLPQRKSPLPVGAVLPHLKEKKRKESSWLASSISLLFHVHRILKHPVLYGARAGVRSRVRPVG